MKTLVSWFLALAILTVPSFALEQAGAADAPTQVEMAVAIQNTDEVDLDPFILELARIPSPILHEFQEQGWSIHLDRAYLIDLSGRHGGVCIGATSYKQQRIYLRASKSLVHEFGHFLDQSLGYPEEVDELFQNESESAELLRPYAKSNRWEYFADCFAFWIQHREDPEMLERFREDMPQTWEYLAALEASGWVAQKTA